MGQIPRSTERISSYYYFVLLSVRLGRSCGMIADKNVRAPPPASLTWSEIVRTPRPRNTLYIDITVSAVFFPRSEADVTFYYNLQ